MAATIAALVRTSNPLVMHPFSHTHPSWKNLTCIHHSS